MLTKLINLETVALYGQRIEKTDGGKTQDLLDQRTETRNAVQANCNTGTGH